MFQTNSPRGSRPPKEAKRAEVLAPTNGPAIARQIVRKS